MSVNVKASDNLFTELGFNTYSFLDLMSELIDNAVAAKSDKSVAEIHIEIGVSDTELDNSYFIIRDNSSGIRRSELGNAISPGGTSGGSSLNAHGLGMKRTEVICDN